MTTPPPLKILYQDNHIIVVLKPRNIPSQADNTGDVDMLSLVKDYIKHAEKKPGNVYVALLHRLDRPTGGIMVFAKTSKAAARMSEQFKAGQVEKKYFAIALNYITKPVAELTHYLVKDTKNNIVRAHVAAVPNSKKAILNYKLLDVRDNLSLVDVNLVTGRSHQIRAQMAQIGHPLYADHKYQALKPVDGYGLPLALWAYSLKFTHPTKGEAMAFKAAPPPEEKYWKDFAIEKYIVI